MRYKDLTGQRFFWLTVIRKFDDPNSKEVKGLFKLVKISPNKKSRNLTVFFPIGKKFLIRTLMMPFRKP